MANYWAIAIGINQYQFFEPLIYPHRDARAIRTFLVNEAGFLPGQSVLLTDMAAPTDPNVMYPSRENIQTTIHQLCQFRLRPGDFLWVFFSGYGVRSQGHDYLMPIDGHAAQAETTGIAMRSLFDLLKAAPTSHIFLTLDMKRSQDDFSEAGVGEETSALADKTGIPTILSARPEQFSYETLALRQGLFTAALLEGLRQKGCVTPDAIAHFLEQRLPELSDYHWRPRQQPLSVVPRGKQHQLLIPERALATVGSGRSPGPSSLEDLEHSILSTTPSVPNSYDFLPEYGPSIPDGDDDGRSPYDNGNGAALVVPPDSGYNEVDRHDASDAIDDAAFWRNVIIGASAIGLILFLGVLLRNWAPLTDPLSPDPSPSPTTEPNGGGTGTVEPLPTSPTPTTDRGGNDPDAGAIPQPFNVGGSEGANPGEPGTSDAGGSSTPGASTPMATGPGFADAGAGAPDTGPNPAASGGETAPPTGNGSQTGGAADQLRQQNQTILDEAKALLSRPRSPNRTNQASDFSQAIAKARQIRPGQPLYDEAQQNIRVWSQVILDLAEGRARQGNLNSAIAAARLIPPDQAGIYNQAQQSITRWQQQDANQEILRRARRLPRQYQASTYNRAIALARQIPQGQPVYTEAQQQINQWSQTILDLARSRAAQGRINEAINTAILVPSNTPAHAPAQQALAQWRNQR